MKKLIVLFISLSMFSAIAATSRTTRNLNVLGPEMKARMLAGEIKIVDIVVVQGKAPKKQTLTSTETILSSLKQPLVIERSCRAEMFYEGSIYDYDEVCVSDGACGCDEIIEEEYRTANIAVDVNFATDFAYELADVSIDLIAIDPITGQSFTITSEYYSVESDIFRSGDNTVIFNIDEAYYLEYTLEAIVRIGDAAGAACSVYSNSL